MRPWIGILCAVLTTAAVADASEEDRALAEMRESSRSVRDLLRATRKKGSRRAIACVDEALSRVDVATRSAASYAKAARAAEARSDDTAALAARTRIRQLREVVAVATKDAQKCTPPPPPPPKMVLGTTVKVTIDPSIPRVTP